MPFTTAGQVTECVYSHNSRDHTGHSELRVKSGRPKCNILTTTITMPLTGQLHDKEIH